MYNTPRLIIRPLQENDTDFVVSWRNDREIAEFLFASEQLTREAHLTWLGRIKDDQTRQEFLLEDKQSSQPIGTIGLGNLDFFHKKGEMGILIGAKKFWGQGYAQEACRFMLNYGFTELGLNKIYLRAFANNEQAIRLYEKIGFRPEGILREDILKHGLFRDVVMMAMLQGEWLKTNSD